MGVYSGRCPIEMRDFKSVEQACFLRGGSESPRFERSDSDGLNWLNWLNWLNRLGNELLGQANWMIGRPEMDGPADRNLQYPQYQHQYQAQHI
ncbi:MAG: hypothetical protein NTAFB09_27530 [Nitrosospira sp.]